jgi:hypothetical protein
MPSRAFHQDPGSLLSVHAYTSSYEYTYSTVTLNQLWRTVKMPLNYSKWDMLEVSHPLIAVQPS